MLLLPLFPPEPMVESLLLDDSTFPGVGVTMDALPAFLCRAGADGRLLLTPALVLIIMGARPSESFNPAVFVR